MTGWSRRELVRATVALGATASAGCVGILGGEGEDGLPADVLPPGTDDSGVTDPDALFEAHRSQLADASYTYHQSMHAGAGLDSIEITGRQQDGTTGRRFARERHTATLRSEPDYVAEQRRVTDAWHGLEMPVDREFHRIQTEVTARNEAAYNRSTFADDSPPGQQTEYRTSDGNSLALYEQTYLLGFVLDPLELAPVETRDVGGEPLVRFEIRDHDPAFQDRGLIGVGGSLLVRSDGLVRRYVRTVEDTWQSEVSTSAMTITDLGSTTVQAAPGWASREFDDASG